ncbi:MAG TPA: bi-domain-containing oxidoreductase, partial [Cytophagaceae bacterium]
NGPHAEIVCVPKNLVALIPDNVSYEEASFTVIASIGLQGIRLANPTFGETIVVSGLGLIGLITAQLLKANGCNVIGFDFDGKKVELAKQYGVQAFNLAEGIDPVKTVTDITNGIGCDAVIITASTKSNDLISQSAQMSRKRGRIILVGVIGLDIKRSDFYEKELTFQVSCSYGPGRYDEDYEKRGIDYPIGFVRWTEKRNFEAILNAISKGLLEVKSLITETVDLENYQQIYGKIGNSDSIASIIKYNAQDIKSTSIRIKETTKGSSKGRMAIIGAGNFTKMTMMPALKKIGAQIKYIVSAGGVSATYLAKKYGVEVSSTRYEDVLQDNSVDSVIITTQHNLHASMTIEALKAGKHVFVEKPLALTEEELSQIIDAYTESGKTLTVGFNRRFSPYIQKAKSLIQGVTEPINIVINVNAGFIPANHWVQNMAIGGGRIIGEGCHFIDLITFLTGSEVTDVVANALGTNPEENSDNVSIILKYKNGSQGVVNYFANGHKSYSKERIEIYSQGRVLTIDNFRKMQGFGFKNFSSMSSSQDKGHKEQFHRYNQFLINGGTPIIPVNEIINSTKASFAAVRSLKSGSWEKV